MTYRLSPGVYATETDLSYVVTSSATTIAGIVVTADRGPTDEVTLVTGSNEFLEKFGTPKPDHPSMYAALAYLSVANQLYVARAVQDAVAASMNAVDSDGNTVFTIKASSEGAWGNGVVVSITEPVDGTFTITATEGDVSESYTVSRDSTKKDGYGQTMYIEDVINGTSNLIKIVDSNELTDPVAVTGEALSGGFDDTVPVTDSEVNIRWDLFATKEEVPVGILIGGGFTSPVVQSKILSIAESRKDCVGILDAPLDETTTSGIVDYSNEELNIDSSYGALYAGWPVIYDQFNDKKVSAPPSGYVAAALARLEDEREVWYAAAGPLQGRIENALGVNIVFSEGDRDVLYQANVNPIQSFRGEGVQIYGQKTLQRYASATDRLNVRMTMCKIYKDITKVLRSFVFQFNDQYTRDNIVSILTAYLDDIKSRRGLYDFLIVCDESNNTSQVIDSNELRVDIYVKPVRVAEFIKMNAIISATGATLS